MKLIDEIICELETTGAHPTAYQYFLAEALYSACTRAAGPNILGISSGTTRADRKRLSELMCQLMNITHEADFSNADQDSAIWWLRENYKLVNYS